MAELFAAGLRMSSLAYNVRSLAADGCIEESNAGLSRFGRRVVREMNRVGMIVDGSHVGIRSTLEAMEVTEAPFVFSHNGCAAVREHPRNLTDEQIRRCAETGGVMGILAIPLFLTGELSAPFEAFLDHVFHALEVVGPEHVGLGLDHWYGMPSYADLVWPVVDTRSDDGVSNLKEPFWDEPAIGDENAPEGAVEGLGTPAGVPLITAALPERGLGEAEVAAIMGGNWMKVLGGSWR